MNIEDAEVAVKKNVAFPQNESKAAKELKHKALTQDNGSLLMVLF